MIWLQAAMLGPVAISICVIAVALLGMAMFTGRIPTRAGLRTVFGCFVIFGAPAIAASFMHSVGGGSSATAPTAATAPAMPLPAREPLKPSTYDPYAGASVRNDSSRN
ncbi:TrbC/VirB2 family protein [Parablastomonas sp. CN1-191]|uniref:TrbC/VirB2 family protein n=1 Tax=Parablastomonas sp. CN1-191 TaxID=3400908 RepID=UPI003BF8CBB4